VIPTSQRQGKTMKRTFLKAVTAAAVLTASSLGVSSAEAQEIQITGPLAGASSVRKLQLYREGRFEFALGPGFTLLDEYKRTLFVSGRLQYNVFEWLGVGVFGGFAPEAFAFNTDLTDTIDATPAPRNSLSAVNLPGTPGQPSFASQVGRMGWMATPQVTFTPFRGKLSLFQKLFVDTDLYLHGGAAFVGMKERANCGTTSTPCTDPSTFKQVDRVAIAPSFGLGFTLYPSNFVSVNLEYRAFPFSFNRGGFDSRGKGPNLGFPDQQINEEDRTFKFNQMVFLAAGFHFPMRPKTSD
jgi:outer membrane beta-barrel protein